MELEKDSKFNFSDLTIAELNGKYDFSEYDEKNKIFFREPTLNTTHNHS